MQLNNINKENSDNHILQKRSLNELDKWMLDLDKISKECNNIELKKLKENNLTDEFFNVVENNKVLESAFFEYRNVLDEYIECIDLDCDLFFYNEHKKNRSLYLNQFNKYKKLKNNIT